MNARRLPGWMKMLLGGLLVGLLARPSVSAQERLGELTFEELPATVLVDEPGTAILEVETTVLPLVFRSSGDLREVREQEPGVYHVLLSPGVHVIVVRSPDFLLLRLPRWRFKSQTVRRVRIRAVTAGGAEAALTTRSSAPRKGRNVLSVGVGNSYGVIGAGYQRITSFRLGLGISAGVWPGYEEDEVADLGQAARDEFKQDKGTVSMYGRYYLSTPYGHTGYLGLVLGPTHRRKPNDWLPDEVLYGLGVVIGYAYLGKHIYFTVDGGFIAFDLGFGLLF